MPLDDHQPFLNLVQIHIMSWGIVGCSFLERDAWHSPPPKILTVCKLQCTYYSTTVCQSYFFYHQTMCTIYMCLSAAKLWIGNALTNNLPNSMHLTVGAHETVLIQRAYTLITH